MKLVRILAVLVALVVPLQGMAAVMAGQCMALGHHDAPASQGHDAHGDHGPDRHGAHHAESDQGASAHCGPCAACCASGPMAGPVIGVTIVPSASEAPYFLSAQPPPRLAPDELDRPPLSL